MRLLLLSILFLHFASYANGQIKYKLRAEIGTLRFKNTTVNVDPGQNWKGYSLNDRQNALSLDIINSISFKNKLLVGVGLGFLNFVGINGYAVFADFQYLPMKSRLTPLVNLKIGSCHIWNQYENGQQSLLFDFSGGVNYSVRNNLDVYLTGGCLLIQQTFLIPIRLGLTFN